MVSSAIAGVHLGGIGGDAVQVPIECVPLALALVFVFRADRVAPLIEGTKTEVT